MAFLRGPAKIFLLFLTILHDSQAHQPEERAGTGKQSNNQGLPFNSQNGGAKFGGNGRDFSQGFNPNQNLQNRGPMKMPEISQSPNNFMNNNNRAPFPGLTGSGRGFEPDMAGPAARGMFDPPNRQQLDMQNLMAGQALLGAANLRQLEGLLQARAQLLGAGAGGGMGRPFVGFPDRRNAALEFAASQLDPITAFSAPFFPVTRQDSGFPGQGVAPYGVAFGGGVGETPVPQFRRPLDSGSSYAMQFPFASAPFDPKMTAVGFAKPLKAVVFLTSQFGISGIFNLSQTGVDQPVEITGRVSGLRPGEHGIHIHALGDVSRSCDSTGAHFNPEGVHHGSPDDVQNLPHAGDLGNIVAGEYGSADFAIATPLISLYPPAPTLVLGRTLVIHEKPDDLGRGGDQQSRETGNSGSRIACGVIGVAH